MIYFLVALVFFILGNLTPKIKIEKPRNEKVGSDNVFLNNNVPPLTRRKMINIKKGHMKPMYDGYSGGFSNTNQCSNCSLIGLYEDMHTINPCRDCGGKVKPYGAAKWMMVDGQFQWAPSQVGNV